VAPAGPPPGRPEAATIATEGCHNHHWRPPPTPPETAATTIMARRCLCRTRERTSDTHTHPHTHTHRERERERARSTTISSGSVGRVPAATPWNSDPEIRSHRRQGTSRVAPPPSLQGSLDRCRPRVAPPPHLTPPLLLTDGKGRAEG
jgi:hypothetical protein